MNKTERNLNKPISLINRRIDRGIGVRVLELVLEIPLIVAMRDIIITFSWKKKRESCNSFKNYFDRLISFFCQIPQIAYLEPNLIIDPLIS